MQTSEFDRVFQQASQHTDWYKKTFQARFLPYNVQMTAVAKTAQRFDWSLEACVSIGTAAHEQSALWSVESMKKTREYFLEQLKKGSEFLDTFEAGFMTTWNDYLRAESDYAKRVSNMSGEERILALASLCEVETEVGSYGYANDAFLTTGNEDWIITEINRELPADVQNRQEIIADLATPVIPSFVNKEEMNLYRIATAPALEQEALLTQHVQDWHWIENSYVESEPLTQEHFAAKIAALINEKVDVGSLLADAEHSSERKAQRKEEIYSQFQFSDGLKSIINLSERISHITDLRKMGVLRLNGFIFPFLRDMQRETGRTFDLLSWVRHQELKDVFIGGNWTLIEERQKHGCMVVSAKGVYSLVQGEDYANLDLSAFSDEESNQGSVSGQVAHPGTITAPARIIRGRNDFHKFQDGDILVTSQTTPEFVPLMKRAAGVITEQGGITCHAAIVSRELQVPCIIGTKTAMNAFEDGELTELNASAGTANKANHE